MRVHILYDWERYTIGYIQHTHTHTHTYNIYMTYIIHISYVTIHILKAIYEISISKLKIEVSRETSEKLKFVERDE